MTKGSKGNTDNKDKENERDAVKENGGKDNDVKVTEIGKDDNMDVDKTDAVTNDDKDQDKEKENENQKEDEKEKDTEKKENSEKSRSRSRSPSR